MAGKIFLGVILAVSARQAATIKIGEWPSSGSKVALKETDAQSVAYVTEMGDQGFDFLYCWGGKATDAFATGDRFGQVRFADVTLQSGAGGKLVLFYDKRRYSLVGDYGNGTSDTDFFYDGQRVIKAIVAQDGNGKKIGVVVVAGVNFNFSKAACTKMFAAAKQRILADHPTAELLLLYSTGVNTVAATNDGSDAYYQTCGFTQLVAGDRLRLFLANSESLTLQTGETAFENTDASSSAGHYAVLSYASTCRVTFADWDGSVLATRECAEGGSVTPPEAPTRAGFTFVGWGVAESAFSDIRDGFTVTAQYEAAGNSHVVTFVDWDGATLQESAVDDGQPAVAPESPTRTGWTFVGWTSEGVDYDLASGVTDDLTLVAKYVINVYEVTFVDWNDDPIGDVQKVEHGGAAVAPLELPSFPENKTFQKWSVAFDEVTEDLTVRAILCDLRIEVTAETFASVLTPDVPAATTVVMVEDVTLADWVPFAFAGTLDGNGHSVRGLASPLFSTLSGMVRDLIVDGMTDGPDGAVPTALAASGSYGVIARDLVSGRIERCSVRGFAVATGLTAAMDKVGIAVGSALNGAVVDGVCVESSCELDPSIGTMAGGVVGYVGQTSDYAGTASVAILNCTNRAAIVHKNGDNNDRSGIGGIVGMIEGDGNSEYVVSHCLNEGVQTSVSLGAHHGGIAGLVSGAKGVAILDCENRGDIRVTTTAKTTLYKNVKLGGIVACTGSLYLGGGIRIERCVNRGALDAGTTDASEEEELTEVETRRQAGGIVGDIGISRYVAPRIVDCANYGALKGHRLGGILCRVYSSSNDNVLQIANCANYGALVFSETAASYGGSVVGEISNGKPMSATIDGVLTTGENFVARASETVTVSVGETVCSIADAGFRADAAKRRLCVFAEESALSPWILGRVGGTEVPEIQPFCLKPRTGFAITIQ